MGPGSLDGLAIDRIDTFSVRLLSLRNFWPAGGAMTVCRRR